ncbi:hypothetical protein E4U60_005072, partial [Claviceps pazoutovae]
MPTPHIILTPIQRVPPIVESHSSAPDHSSSVASSQRGGNQHRVIIRVMLTRNRTCAKNGIRDNTHAIGTFLSLGAAESRGRFR